MIIQTDVKGLEVATAAYLSQDKVLLKELWDNVDIHKQNEIKFNLPDRLIAKKFKFRILYGGSAYAFSVDSEFKSVKFSKDRWQQVIDEYYEKYYGLYTWHQALIHEATTTGRVACPTGRWFPFKPYDKNGDIVWPKTTIKNYPVQGTGADLVSLARVDFSRKLRQSTLEALPIATVHDSIVVDSPKENVDAVCRMLFDSVAAIPRLFEETFGLPFNVPITSEISIGPNLGDLEEIKIAA